ncbi:MAG: cobyrinate a,c-diamide synthase [Paracoccaceae bacterium]|nr:cobyrinate a,c-diamide synthase [Paracoccaceae bacterium]
MHLPRFMISAAHKSSGKTVVSLGLAAAFKNRGRDIGTFKKGPDYIDPMWLSAASGKPCYNLDFNAMQDAEILPFFQSRARALNLVEANKGLFDGVAEDGSDSNAALAKTLQLPVILVIDTNGMTRGIAPLLQGYLQFDPDVQIVGVILNKTGGPRHESKLRAAVETYTDLPVLGAIGHADKLNIGERHLGLTTPAESPVRDGFIAYAADTMATHVDLDRIEDIARHTVALPGHPAPQPVTQIGKGLEIGIARDRAFGFYYPDDLEAIAALGATLIPFDTMKDTHLPDVDGLFIGGGFPEMFLSELQANTSLRTDIRTKLQNGLPAYAECGGLMYLCRSIRWHDTTAEMVGLIDADALMHSKPTGRGHVRFETTDTHPWGTIEGEVRAHEFHYAGLSGLPENTRYARRMTRGFGVNREHDGIIIANTLAGFCHLRNTGPYPWVPKFLEFVRSRKN